MQGIDKKSLEDIVEGDYIVLKHTKHYGRGAYWVIRKVVRTTKTQIIVEYGKHIDGIDREIKIRRKHGELVGATISSSEGYYAYAGARENRIYDSKFSTMEEYATQKINEQAEIRRTKKLTEEIINSLDGLDSTRLQQIHDFIVKE